MKNVMWFKELSKANLAEAGGKGANLGEMYQNGFPIPNGFVITSDAYYHHLEANHLKDKITHILTNLDVADQDKLQAASDQIKKLITEGAMPKDIHDAIVSSHKTLTDMTGRPIYVAVRSSATAEDLPSIAENEHVFVRLNGKSIYCTAKELFDCIGTGENVLLEVPAMKNNKLNWHKANLFYKHKANNEKLYKIMTKTGRTITISPKHSLIVLNKSTLAPKTTLISELASDDLIPTVYNLPVSTSNLNEIDVLDYVSGEDVVLDGNFILIKNKSNNWKIQTPLQRKLELSEEFLYFLGLYVAEGCTYEDNCVIITNSDPKILARVTSFLKSVDLKSDQKVNKHSIRIYCKSLVRLLHSVCGKPLDQKGKGRSCKIKRVPNFIFDLSKDKIAHFVRGAFDGDGYVGDHTIQYCSTSHMLIGGMAKLLEILNFDLYFINKPGSFNILIPYSGANKFARDISFVSTDKLSRLDSLIENYDSQNKHIDKNQLTISPEFSQKMKKECDSKLEKNIVTVACCRTCKNQIGKSSDYQGKLRYYCNECHKTFYESEVQKVQVEKYVGYDSKGHFKKNARPWNSGLFYGKHSIKDLQSQLQSHDATANSELLNQTFNGDVRWEEIKEVQELNYDGFVYDFSVPEIENFVSGVGGIITHNTASFAGQQSTYLNVHGAEEVVAAVKDCWASLFEARAIYYRVENKFDHMKVGLAAVIQMMVQSEKAGVVFTVDPLLQDRNIISIETGYGLGEVVVSGQITPDTYKISKEPFGIIDKKISKQTWMLIKIDGKNKRVEIKDEAQSRQKLSDMEIKDLAKVCKKIEEHYGYPQDIEYAFERDNLYIVQSRPITTLKDKSGLEKGTGGELVKDVSVQQKPAAEKAVVSQDVSQSRIILRGLGCSPGMGMGKVKIIKNSSEIKTVIKGDILVTEMTSPDYVPAMKRAAAIITDTGGMTSHAAIVSRELGVPCVVGTGTATTTLKNDMDVSVDGSHGIIYEGFISAPEAESKKGQDQQIHEAVAITIPITGTKIYVNLADVDQAEKISKLPADGVGLLRAEFMIAGMGEHPRKMLEEKRRQEFVDRLADDLRKFAAAFYPRPVVYRATDFKTNEYRNLAGGDKYEPHEENPMMGYRGAARYIKEPELFKMELDAIKKVREEFHLPNLWLMIPFVRRIGELRAIKDIMDEVQLFRTRDFKLWIMVEVPSTVVLIDQFCAEGIDGISIGTNDLTQLTLGIDRDNATMASGFDERNEAVLRSLKRVVTICNKFGVTSSLCGQAPSVYPEFAEKLVEFGITSMSVNPDAVERTRKIVASAEQKIILRRLSALTQNAEKKDDLVNYD